MSTVAIPFLMGCGMQLMLSIPLLIGRPKSLQGFAQRTQLTILLPLALMAIELVALLVNGESRQLQDSLAILRIVAFSFGILFTHKLVGKLSNGRNASNTQ